MKDILDIVVVVMFVIIVFGFIKGFNQHQIDKHVRKMDEREETQKEKND